MHPIHDVDVLLLLATALASKRRPAQLAEIMAATDLLHGSIPLDVELAAGFQRLSSHGLIADEAGGLRLTPAALQIMDSLPRKQKAETADRLLAIREQLAGYTPRGEAAAIAPTTEQLTAAILAHRTFLKTPGRNMLVPKPKAALDKAKRPGQWRRPDGGRRAKS
ncbi:MAG: hypothetical protein Q8M11_06790 [Sulfuritalea sp.]|nr:hypothetical protein [Sulfuritalea sp.]MDP1982875.1 hypothetical protein [Sulfuritalea sp.]